MILMNLCWNIMLTGIHFLFIVIHMIEFWYDILYYLIHFLSLTPNDRICWWHGQNNLWSLIHCSPPPLFTPSGKFFLNVHLLINPEFSWPLIVTISLTLISPRSRFALHSIAAWNCYSEQFFQLIHLLPE